MSHYHEQLQGWSDFTGFYKECVSGYASGSRFVEVGVWRGRSAIAMAEYIRESGKAIEFFAVDHFQGSVEHQQELTSTGDDLLSLFREHLKQAGVEEFVNVVPRPSLEAAETFDLESCDFIFLDASHDHASVMDDLHAWWPKIKPGGTLAGHDWSSYWPGVVSAVKGFAAQKSLAIGEIGSTWVISK